MKILIVISTYLRDSSAAFIVHREFFLAKKKVLRYFRIQGEEVNKHFFSTLFFLQVDQTNDRQEGS